jgi:hypothetical protein
MASCRFREIGHFLGESAISEYIGHNSEEYARVQVKTARGIGHFKIAPFSRLSGSFDFLCLLAQYQFLGCICRQPHKDFVVIC